MESSRIVIDNIWMWILSTKTYVYVIENEIYSSRSTIHKQSKNKISLESGLI